MIVGAFDPSSSRIGYAFADMTPEKPSKVHLVDAGLLTPVRDRDPYLVRVDEMVQSVGGLLAEYKPKLNIIEVPSGKVAGRLRNKNPSGLSVYGFGAGAAWQMLRDFEDVTGCDLWEVDENTWTNQIPKDKRQAIIAMEFPQYRADDDPGGDTSDAIGLLLWASREIKFGRLPLDRSECPNC